MPRLTPPATVSWYVHTSTSRTKKASSHKHSYMHHGTPATVVVPHTSNLVTKHIANNTGTKLHGPYTTQGIAEAQAAVLRAKASPAYVYCSKPVCSTPKKPPKPIVNTTPLANKTRARQIKRGY